MAEHIINNIPVLQERVQELEQFCAFAEEVAEKVDSIVHNLHTTWKGASAQAQREFHEQWHKDHEQMITDVFRLKAALNVAAHNGARVQKIHANMWPPVV